MPALIFLKRKWLIACDDLVIPFFISGFIRLMWLSSAMAITWLKIKNCNDYELLNYFLYVILVDLVGSSSISFAVCYISSRGSVMEVAKRKNLSKLLYVKLLSVIIEIGLASAGIWFFTQMRYICLVKEIFLKVTIISAWIYILIVIGAIVVCYDTLGSSKYWDKKTDSNSLNFFKKAKFIWKWRLKLFCCCADISEENNFIYVEISTFLASFLKGIDLVPTDILAGIITLSQKHALQRRQHLLDIQQLAKSDAWLKAKPIPEWMTPENALYFLRIAKSTYGWLLFFNTFRPWYLCNLASHIRCCASSCCFNDSTKIDNCCQTNIAAVKKITEFSDSEILFASFENSIYEPAFFVAVDNARKSIVISIRGTGSFSDIITDIDAEPLWFSTETENCFKCHRGSLRSALYIQKKLKDLNILGTAFKKNPSYTLVVTGHSLGGSTAAVLSFLLKPEYPNLQCYIYGPMGTISPSAIEESLDFIFTIVVGDDMSPRLCGNAGRHLRREIIDSLKESKIPKYRLLITACLYHVTKYFKMRPKVSVREVYENKQFQNDEEINRQTYSSTAYSESSLYAPGRILYFEKNDCFQPFWLTGINFQKIIVNPDMFADHQPHTIQSMLENYIRSVGKNSNTLPAS